MLYIILYDDKKEVYFFDNIGRFFNVFKIKREKNSARGWTAAGLDNINNFKEGFICLN